MLAELSSTSGRSSYNVHCRAVEILLPWRAAIDYSPIDRVTAALEPFGLLPYFQIRLHNIMKALRLDWHGIAVMRPLLDKVLCLNGNS